ncbi:MAG: glycosyltransferase family 2 protein [Candidatus Cloacimonas sp.]
MESLSAVLIVKNEAQNITRCFKSLAFADEIVVLDTGSNDETVNICKNLGAKVYYLDQWKGFGKAKQKAVDLAYYDWILSLDADEELSAELQKELQELKKRNFDNSAWRIKRRSFYLDKPIRFCGWQNDAPVRLFNRKKSRFNEKLVHEGIQTSQPIKKCKHYLWHYTNPTREQHFAKMRFYAELSAKQLYQQGKKSNELMALARGINKFCKMFIFQLGFLDGATGFILCKNSAWGIWYRYHLLGKMQK